MNNGRPKIILDYLKSCIKYKTFSFLKPHLKAEQALMDQYKGKKFCLIGPGADSGFFSVFFRTLGNLYVCEKNGVSPVVYWGQPTPFWVKDGYRGAKNAWEYYFEPVSGLSITDFEDAADQEDIIRANEYFHSIIPTVSFVDESARKPMSEIIKKYVHIRNDIMEEINDFYTRKFQNKKVIGLHFRKEKAKAIELESRFLGFLSLKYSFKEVDRYLESNPSALIFVSTDSYSVHEQIKNRYKDKVISHSELRTIDGEPNTVKKLWPKIGEHILIDCILLSKCDYFVHGISNISTAACFFNPELKHRDVYKKYHAAAFIKWFNPKRSFDNKKRFYILSEQESGRGFFAMFLTVLENLQHCEKKGYIFIPDWKDTSYSEIAHGYNAWDYYFEPLSGYSLEQAEITGNKIIRVRWDKSQFEMKPIKINDRLLTKRETYNYYIKKYIKIRPEITKKVDDFFNENMKGHNILGVHIRRTDKFFCTSVPLGGYPVSDEKIIENIDRYIEKNPSCKIFIATDDKNIFEKMKKLYKNKVMSWDSIRSSDGTPVHKGILGKELQGVSNYKKGEDALIDCLLLSRCDFLIRGTSNLSAASLCFNPDLKQLDLNWLNNNCKVEDWIESIPFNDSAKNELALRVPRELQPESHSYATYNGPWIENYFYSYWQRNEKRLSEENKIDRIYIPIFWTDYYVKYGNFNSDNKIQNYINKNINPNKKYFTIVQNDDGILEKLPKNVLIFSAGGVGDIPIPLVKGEPKPADMKRDILCSFMGPFDGAHDKTGVRSKMRDILKKEEGFYFGQGPMAKFIDITNRSVFTLCPRGYGRTSFRLYEALALGSIPIYIWDDFEWLPYKDKLNWNEFAVSINIRDLEKLPGIISAHTPEMIRQKQEKIKQLYGEYFTYEGACNQIIKMLSIN